MIFSERKFIYKEYAGVNRLYTSRYETYFIFSILNYTTIIFKCQVKYEKNFINDSAFE